MSDLSAPLNRKRARGTQARATSRRRVPIARLAFGAVAVLLVGAALRIALVETPEGGRPVAEVPVNTTRNANSVAGANARMPDSQSITVGPEIAVEELDSALAQTEPTALDDDAPAEPDAFGTLPKLVESTEFGPLPQTAKDGETPFAAYSRPSVTQASAGGKPLIAIVVTGLGLNIDGTLAAISQLPDTVTLAFAPYGKNVERTVGTARSEGHEVFLEVPLEPFDYPDNDPGPDTLLTGQAPRENMEKLYRVMGKFSGYAGLINNMGARFTASAADFGPMIEELGTRGLGYLDDGTSNRSLAPQLAKANGVPFARAAMTLDANPARAPILAKLAELEQKAREDGSAIGLVAALPVSVETVAEWARDAEERGLLIVPASALMRK